MTLEIGLLDIIFSRLFLIFEVIIPTFFQALHVLLFSVGVPVRVGTIRRTLFKSSVTP